ncbi:LacI family DNA-binding transcriptional regulator [Ichthyenterobacterium sp. W332]|uniref:LacI family DNA-binding transcriptional regulator n=1 Tax=Microcosmobacter mediterraneus TaxID=3075607 RepID=A0ABU2YKN8_9FLAO|nr:LacI family DNA-binding transcriptional regulator [Ichthyenterobacterium sp. W332]MDT0558461.1 LacI family DNA-binding transcriptional regulator [Ichthyenterobacterium sp. W332]
MITMKELAKKLDVSVSTVSKALSDSPEISPSTIKKIKEIAKLYNYKPNQAALNLKNSETKTIGVIIPDILNPFFAKVLHGIEEEASNLGYNIITSLSNETQQKEEQSIELLSNGSVDGFILSVAEETQLTKNSDHFKACLSNNLPLVMFDRVAEDISCDKIIIDDYKAAYEATEFLISKQRKHILLISTIDNLSVGKMRVKGYLDAIKNHSQKNHILTIDKKEAHHKILEYLISNTNIDGILAIDNSSGVKGINIATALGKKVPKDISVIGFANESIACYSIPKLSTVNQHAEDIGKKSVNLMVERLKNKDSKTDPKTIVVPIKIEERSST